MGLESVADTWPVKTDKEMMSRMNIATLQQSPIIFNIAHPVGRVNLHGNPVNGVEYVLFNF